MAPLSRTNSGWIKLHRELIDKPIWSHSTPEQKVILVTTLLLANHADQQWEWKGKKFICKPGQFITSLPSLAKASGCSIQNVRTALKRFREYEFLTDQSAATGRLITLINWEKYQARPEETVKGQQTDNRPIPPINPDTNKNLTGNITDVIGQEKPEIMDINPAVLDSSTDALTDNQQTLNRPLTPNKNVKNVKNVENLKNYLYNSEFEKWYSKYPRPQAKADSLEILRRFENPKE